MVLIDKVHCIYIFVFHSLQADGQWVCCSPPFHPGEMAGHHRAHPVGEVWDDWTWNGPFQPSRWPTHTRQVDVIIFNLLNGALTPKYVEMFSGSIVIVANFCGYIINRGFHAWVDKGLNSTSNYSFSYLNVTGSSPDLLVRKLLVTGYFSLLLDSFFSKLLAPTGAYKLHSCHMQLGYSHLCHVFVLYRYIYALIR